MRVATDGFIDVRDGRRVRTPGLSTDLVEPMPEGEALSFLLSHSFPGHRRIVRCLNVGERRSMQLAAWADSVSEKMALVDRVWRAITEPVLPPPDHREPQLVQIVQFGSWSFPIYLDGASTRVMPHGGVPVGEVERSRKGKVIHLDRKTA